MIVYESFIDDVIVLVINNGDDNVNWVDGSRLLLVMIYMILWSFRGKYEVVKKNVLKIIKLLFISDVWVKRFIVFELIRGVEMM